MGYYSCEKPIMMKSKILDLVVLPKVLRKICVRIIMPYLVDVTWEIIKHFTESGQDSLGHV